MMTYFTQGSSLDLVFQPFHFLLFHSLQVVQAYSPRFPPNSKFPSLLTFPGRSILPSLAHFFCPPLPLPIPNSSPENHTMFSYLCHECCLPPDPWFFPWRAICSHSTEKIILLTSTAASVPWHILFPLPGTAHTLLSTPLMAHTSYTRLTQAQASPALGTRLRIEHINYVFSTLKSKQHSFLEKVFRKNRAKLTQTFNLMGLRFWATVTISFCCCSFRICIGSSKSKVSQDGSILLFLPSCTSLYSFNWYSSRREWKWLLMGTLLVRNPAASLWSVHRFQDLSGMLSFRQHLRVCISASASRKAAAMVISYQHSSIS